MLSVLAPNLCGAIAQTQSYIKQYGFHKQIHHITQCQHTSTIYMDKCGHKVTEVNAYNIYRKHHPKYNITFTEFLRRY